MMCNPTGDMRLSLLVLQALYLLFEPKAFVWADGCGAVRPTGEEVIELQQRRMQLCLLSLVIAQD